MDIKRIVFMDVDGTLTDGKLYIGYEGEIMKAFDIKDGYAIAHMSEYGYLPVIITGRYSKIVDNRCKELGIKEIYQGVDNKLLVVNKILSKYGLSSSDAIYIGDDLNDLDCLMYCKYKICPKDAAKEIKLLQGIYISPFNGGDGVVRDFFDNISIF